MLWLFNHLTMLASLVSCGGTDTGTAAASTATDAASTGCLGGSSGTIMLIALPVLMIVLFLVMSIPQRKREKKVKGHYGNFETFSPKCLRIDPEFAAQIYRAAKTWEFRKRPLTLSDNIYLFETAPVNAITGVVRFDKIEASRLRLTVAKSAAKPLIRDFSVYCN